MRTPIFFTNMLKQGGITEEILGMVIYSYNKRAKNYRDKQRDCRYDRLHGDKKYRKSSEDRNREMKNAMYLKKDYLLSKLQPNKIHLVTLNKEKRVRYYDYEDEYHDLSDEDVIKRGSYVDKYDNYNEVEFADVIEIETVKNFYKYYEVGRYSFHSPIDPKEVDTLGLEIEKIEELNTYGKEIIDLLSVQFCDKVVDLFKKGELIIKRWYLYHL